MDEYEKSKINTSRYNKILKLLKKKYGYTSFKPKQYEIINNIINGKDMCAVLPTGYGKSLTFQIPALYQDKVGIIICPLIALMNDQQQALKKIGVSACCYNSTVDDKFQMRTDIINGKYSFVYVAPESLTNLKETLKKLDKKKGIALFAVDEAHCISQYGFDFRKAYRELTFLKNEYPDIPILAVTATATKKVAKDICDTLGLSTRKPITSSFDRENLHIEINLKVNPEMDILSILNKHKDSCCIIYCHTKKETEKIADMLNNNDIYAEAYHAGMTNISREKVHNKFIKGKLNIVVATIAFGMGINKSNVRVVIHYGCPKNIEGYYQEIGRAGRDGKKAFCYMFYKESDFAFQKHQIDQIHDDTFRTSQKKLLEVMQEYARNSKICRKKILLRYFDETIEIECNMCDICCGKTERANVSKTKLHDIYRETVLLINLIESIKNRQYGKTLYINILRGSNNKSIQPFMKKNPYYGKGTTKSVEWWNELFNILIVKDYIQQNNVKTSRYPMSVITVTKKGATLSTIDSIGDILDETAIKMASFMKDLSKVEMIAI
jgi:Werner syndrome ATP-dependent helicase